MQRKTIILLVCISIAIALGAGYFFACHLIEAKASSLDERYGPVIGVVTIYAGDQYEVRESETFEHYDLVNRKKIECAAVVTFDGESKTDCEAISWPVEKDGKWEIYP